MGGSIRTPWYSLLAQVHTSSMAGGRSSGLHQTSSKMLVLLETSLHHLHHLAGLDINFDAM